MVFGSKCLYFDQAVMLGDQATYSGDAVFSTVKLYVPRQWAVDYVGDKILSSIKIVGAPTTSEKQLLVTGDLVFSSMEIHYI
ncbi:hypothetical protein [Streptococcus sp. DD13]|uniref:hypothetical protein n=1 Tax=Streptococcus sp. DD13 TaxID=1777881 RepID=UPI0007954237|nr:hypothetical protein [Streptococcus sp. DD13]KXT77685.1 hypothetical protein STRDD13_01365 [Streptococcus sp. DD13]